MGKIVSIVHKPARVEANSEGYCRAPLDTALLVAGLGIQGDGKASRNRNLNIMASETVRTLAREGFKTLPGEMGEQLIVEGIEIDALSPGTQLQFGGSAVVELTEPRTGCAKLERYQGKTREDAARRLGMMAKVVAGGTIKVGDTVTMVQRSEERQPSLF